MEQEKLYVRAEMTVTRFTDDMFTMTASEACDTYYEVNGHYPDDMSRAGCISAMENPNLKERLEEMTVEEFRKNLTE